MSLDLNQNPYFDDFDSSKNYHKILFRPSYAVQARELTQIQTILQNQIKEFGKNIFKNGSIVTGGQTITETTSVKYVCIESSDTSNNAINVDDWIGNFVIDGDGAGIRAYVIAGKASTTTAPTVLIVKYTSGSPFNVATTNPISLEDGSKSVRLLASLTSPTTFTDVTSGSILGDASICSIDLGVFFIDGYFVEVDPQTIILNAFNNTPSYRVGLEISDEIVDALADSTLLDPAIEASNFQAPGANRYKYSLTLSKRSLDSTDDSKFIELLRLVSGQLVKKVVYPTYSVLEETLARRTNDQSGSFTVRPFRMAFEPHDTYANAYNIVMEPGKAYVQGYEFETIAPSYIKSERARDVANVTNYNTNIDFQNWVEVENLRGPIPFNTLQAAAVHCVNTASIAVANAAVAANTLIGTLRIRALDYQSGANATSISTGVWRAYTFDANIASSVVANCKGNQVGTANTIYLANNFSAVSNAYVGVKLTIVANNGSTLNETVTIGRYDGPNNLATLQTTETFAFGIPGASTRYRLDYEFKDAEAIVYSNTVSNQHTFSTQMDVSTSSKWGALIDNYQGAYLSDTGFNSAILQLPYPTVADQTVSGGLPLTNSEYWGRKSYTSQTFSANVISITSAAGITSAVNGSPLSGSDAIDNILVVLKSNTGTTLANNQVINFANTSNTVAVTTASNTSTWTITVPGAGSAAQADVYVKVKLPYSHTLGNLIRSKTLREANIANALVTGGTTMPDANSGLVQWYSQGSGTLGAQVSIYANSQAWLNLRTPGTSQSLYTSDGYRLRKVYDLGTLAISDANVAVATDITARYTFDTGQRDNSYDHASIALKNQSQGPGGNVVVYLDYFTHAGLGYLTVDSYVSGNVTYANIPTYTSATTGLVYNLRDCIDFRPRRQDADVLGIFDEELFGQSGLSFETDFSYYLARIDKVVLTKDRTFEVLTGVPSLFPVAPADKDNAMTLYTVMLPPYTAFTTDIRQRYNDNRRYTMRDIGTLEKRISNLEYYTSLNLLEQAAKNQEIVDDLGLNRFKNGILVDPFTGHSIGDVMNEDYHCAVDPQSHELRPPFALGSLLLDFYSTNSLNYARTGSIFSLPYTSATLVDQPYASLSINVNPFNTISFIGQIKLDPTSDTWIDTNRVPDVHVNLEGDNDAWAALTAAVQQVNPGKIFGTTWNSWQTTWTGVHKNAPQTIRPAWRGWLGPLGHYVPVYGNIISRQVTDITQTQVRQATTTTFTTEAITQSIGDRVIDSSVIPTIRSRGVLFLGAMFAPNTTLYAFFDDVPVTNYCNKLNMVKVSSNTVTYQDEYQNGEIVRVYDPARGANTAFGLVIRSRHEADYTNVAVASIAGGDDANVANSYVIHSTNSTFLIGVTSGANSRISGYYHFSGFVTNPNTTSIILSHDMANSNNGISNTTIVGETIRFTASNGAGQSATIMSYNYITRNVGFSPALSTAITDNTSYTIGDFSSDYRGEVAGIYIIPSSEALSFRSGEREFKLVDTTSGEVDLSNTNGSVKYFAQGLLQTVENTVISTRVPKIQRTVVNENRTVSTQKVTDTVIGRQQIGYWDPLAQTFLIDQKNHPSGVMITGVRLLFKSKDANIPLQVQIRPVVNGFPHSSQVVPGADIVVNPTEINTVNETDLGDKYNSTTSNNPLDDLTMATQINFEGPVYLQQGAEYALILMANSVKYEVYISEMGKKIIGTQRIISEQPYMGSFFKSQNSQTWTPVQEQDLTFRILYANFDTSVTANLEFRLSDANEYTANVPLDCFYVTAGNLLLPNTTIDSYYATTTATGIKEEAKKFQLERNVYFDDTIGRRVATTDLNSLKIRILLSSLNTDISPLVDLERLSVFAIENLVNNLPLSNASFTVQSSSRNWQTAANLTVTVSGGGGSGANVYISNNQINANTFTLDNVVCDVVGSGYTTSPTVSFSGNTALSATIVAEGENQPSGGPAVARYITRKVTLADGMDAGDFRVYLSAYKPSASNIYVYYKILSADDSDSFDSKSYQLMTIIQGVNNVSLNQEDVKDFVFAPGANNIADDRVQYGTFVSFKYFAIKVVMTATDTTKVPRISNFRVVALPALS